MQVGNSPNRQYVVMCTFRMFRRNLNIDDRLRTVHFDNLLFIDDGNTRIWSVFGDKIKYRITLTTITNIAMKDSKTQ